LFVERPCQLLLYLNFLASLFLLHLDFVEVFNFLLKLHRH